MTVERNSIPSSSLGNNSNTTQLSKGLTKELANSSTELANDCISRQAAIDELGYCQTYLFDSRDKDKKISLEDAEYAIEQLPYAQPEPCEDAVSRQRLLNDLKELKIAWEKYPVMAEQIKGVETAIGYVEAIPSVTPKPEPCEDAVSRNDVIRWVKTECNPYGKPTLDFESGKKVIEHLKHMSPVTPKRKTGKWIVRDDSYSEFVECDQCGHTQDYSSNYCPNCGAMNSESLKAAEIGKEVARGLKSGVRCEKNEV